MGSAELFSYLTLTHGDSARVVNRLLTRKIHPRVDRSLHDGQRRAQFMT
jgi:hypothetical protein